MSSQPSSSIRFSCPQCGGNVKVPPQQAGHKCRCPRCDADIIAPGGAPAAPKSPESRVESPEPRVEGPAPRVRSPAPPPGVAAPPGGFAARAAPVPTSPRAAPAPASASPPADSFAEAVYPQPDSAAESLRPAARVGIPLDNEEIGVDCRVCGTRLHVRRLRIGETVKCPDCHSPIVVKAPPKRIQATPPEYEEAEMFKLSELVELPSTTYVPPGNPAGGTASGVPAAAGMPAGAGKPAGGGTIMQNAAHSLMEKARVQQQTEAAEERESSAERFTQGLLAFLADPQALVRLGILAVWFEVAMTLRHWADWSTVSGGGSAILSHTTSLVAMVALAFVGLTFLYAGAACALALVQDSSQGLLKIENWPGVNFLQWGRGVFYIINAGFLAALPGAAVGIVLALAGIPAAAPATIAASFAALFPPILLSMLAASSALVPVSNEVWGGILERPHPWSLTYLATGVLTMGGLMGFYGSFFGGFFAGLLGAVGLVACAMVYFRTVGWLMRFLAGGDEPPAAKKA